MEKLLLSSEFWTGIGTAFSIVVPLLLLLTKLGSSSKTFNIYTHRKVISPLMNYDERKFLYTFEKKSGSRVIRDIFLLENNTKSVIDLNDFTTPPSIKMPCHEKFVYLIDNLRGNQVRQLELVSNNDGWAFDDFSLLPNEASIISILHDGDGEISFEGLLKDTSKQKYKSFEVPNFVPLSLSFLTFVLVATLLILTSQLSTFEPAVNFISEYPIFGLVSFLVSLTVCLLAARYTYQIFLSSGMRIAKREIGRSLQTIEFKIFGKEYTLEKKT